MQPGMSIRQAVRPDAVARKMDAEDFRNVTRIIDNPDNRTQYAKMLEDMGLKNATDDELISFLKEVVDEFEGVAGRSVN
jgi:hypothetical protein